MNSVFFRALVTKTQLHSLLRGKPRFYRTLDSATANMSVKRMYTELRIPTSYGFTAAKDWGPAGGRPVLAIHGWQDNAGSFDTLIPWLNPSFRVVALELPGHGFSSHKPAGSYYHFMEYLLDIKRAVDFLECGKVTILAHSMGGALSLLYASIFPDDVDTLITLDIIKPITWSSESCSRRTATAIKQHLIMEEQMKKKTPVYSEENALKRMIAGQQGSLTEASARTMMLRGAKPSEDGTGVVYTRDLRLQIDSIQRIDSRLIKNYLNCLRCNLLVIIARNGIKLESAETIAEYRQMFSHNCKRFRFIEVDGTHHVHMNNPEVVGPLVNAFLDTSQL